MTLNGSDVQHMCYAGSALQDACTIMYNDGSEGEGESEWERKGSWDAIKMHEASRLMQPCNLTVTQQLCNHTLERGRLKCVYAWRFARVSVHALCEWGYVFVSISQLEGLFPFSGLSLCQHITVHTCPNQCWSHSGDLTSAASPHPVSFPCTEIL